MLGGEQEGTDPSPVMLQVCPPLPACTHVLPPEAGLPLALPLGCTSGGHHPEGQVQPSHTGRRGWSA